MGSDEPVTIGIDYPTRADRRTHIERICPLPNGESPAWLPRASQWHAEALRPDLEPEKEMPEGERKRYMLMAPGYHADVRLPAGEVVWLYDNEVGPHHRRVDVDEFMEVAESVANDESGEAEEGTPSEVGEAAAPKKSRRAKE